jgi:hypothetical protein
MLDGDELTDAQRAAEAFRDRAIPQFWDGERKLGGEIARSLGVEEWTAWDIYLFYPAGARWTDAGMPPPQAALAQAGGVVIASKGLLPAVPLDSNLPERFRDRVDVVGPQTDLDSLLARVAAGYVNKL